MAESIDLNALVDTERQAMQNQATAEAEALIAASEAIKEQWRALFALDQDQLRALEVAGQVSRALKLADIPRDINFHRTEYKDVPTGRFRKRNQTEAIHTSTVKGWLLREALDTPPPQLMKPKFHDEFDVYKSAALDEDGELRIVHINKSNGLPRRSVVVNGELSVPTRHFEFDRIGRNLAIHTISDVDKFLARDEVFTYGPGRESIQRAEESAEISRAAIPYMARLLVLHDVEPVPVES